MNDNNFVKLGDVAHECRLTWSGEQTNIPIVGLEHLIPGEIELSSWDRNIEHTFSKKFTKGQVLLGRRRVYLKKAVVAPCDGICSGDITVIESTGGILPELLPFVIQNDRFFDYAMQGSAGSLSPRVKWEHLKNYEFSLPSLAEQKVLADKLWTAYRLKESYKKLLTATEEMVKSQFIEMFGNPLSSVQRYTLKKLGDCCELNPRRPNLDIEDTDNVSFVPMPSVSENGFLQDVADEEYGKVKKGFTYFENGDVLFAKITPCMENGKGAIAEGLTNNIGMGSTEFHVLRPIEGVSSPYWLLALTRLPIFRERASKNMTGTGGQKRVPANYLENFMVGLPPIEEQNRYENIYKQADKSGFDGRKSQFIEMFGDFHNKVQIKDVCLVVSGKSIPTKLEDIDGNNPYIKVADFNIPGNEKYITIAQRYVSDDSASYSKQIPEGSVIFAKNGAASMSNKKRLTKIRCCIDMNTMAVFPKNESILSDFLFATIEAMDVSTHVRQGAIPSISPKSIEDSYIAMPTMEEQYRYVSIAKHADKSGSVLQHMIAC